MPKGTSSQLFVKVPQICAETIEGTPITSGTYVNIGAVLSLSIKKDGGWQDVGQLGKEDLIALVQGLQTYETQVKLAVLNTNFVKRLVNAANPSSPSGTVSEPFTMVFSIYLDGVENYIVCKGSRPKDGEFVREAGKVDEWTVTMVHTKITVPSTSHGIGGTPIFDNAPSGAVYSSYSGGANSVSLGGIALNCKKISVKFNRNTKEDHTIGNPDPFGSLNHGRRVTWDMDVIWTNNSMETDYETPTAKTLAVVLKTSTDTLTLSNSNVTAYSRDDSADSDMMTVEKITGKSLSCTIA